MTSRRQFLTGLMAASAAGASPTIELDQDTQDMTAHVSNGHEVRWVPAECAWSFRMNGWQYTGRINRMLKGYVHCQMYRPLPDHQGTDTSG